MGKCICKYTSNEKSESRITDLYRVGFHNETRGEFAILKGRKIKKKTIKFRVSKEIIALNTAVKVHTNHSQLFYPEIKNQNTPVSQQTRSLIP